MAVSIGDTTVGNSARAATGIFNGPVTFGDNYGESEDKAARRCRNAMFLTDPTIDRDVLIRSKGNRTKGTCEWIMRNDTFKAWREGRPMLLWIRGGPGKGKTIMSVYIIQELPHDQQQETIYYFCIGQDERRNSAAAVLRGLVWQILQLYPNLTTIVLPFFDPPERGIATVASEETLWQLFKQLVGAVTCKALYCVVDGMDECDADSVYWLASKFLETDNNHDFGSLRLLVLSRDIPALGRGVTRIKLDPDYRGQVSADVEIFVRSQVDQLSRRLHLGIDFNEVVVRALLERCEGTFLWVGFVMRELSQKRTRTQIEEAVNSLPRGLPAFYSKILSQIGSGGRPKSVRLLTWLAMSFKPLSLQAYADVLECEATDTISQEEATLDEIALCVPMIAVEGHEIRFVHQSAKDYLLRPEHDGDQGLGSFRIQPETAHLLMAQKCLQALANETWLQYYSLMNWPKHARCCSTKQLLEREHWFFAEQSSTRDSWWRKYSMNFRELPQVAPPRLHIACYLGLDSWISWILAELQGPKEPVDLPLDTQHPTWIKMILASLQGRKKPVDLLLDTRCSRGWIPLDYAAEGGHAASVKLLLEHSSSSGQTTALHQDALKRAVLAGREISVRLLLQHDFNPNLQDVEGRSLLHHAVILEHWTIADLLLGHGANPCLEDNWGLQPVNGAYSLGREALVRRMLEAGADPNSQNRQGNMLIHLATADLRPRMVQLLIQHGGKINAKDQDGNTALHILFATSQQRLLPNVDLENRGRVIHSVSGLVGLSMKGEQLFQLLLTHQADTNVVNNTGDLALHVASSKGLSSVIGRLIDRTTGLKLDVRNNQGKTALLVALSHGHQQIATSLLASRADPNIVDDEGTSALHLAAGHGMEAVVRLLVKNADLNLQDAQGNTALSIAVAEQQQDIAEVLLDSGADPNILNDEGTSALHLAAKHRMQYVAWLLVKQGAHVNIQCATGFTALYIAAKAGQHSLASFLVSSGADRNLLDILGKSALHAVAAAGHQTQSLAQLLIESGVKIETQDSEGNTALHIAFAAGTCSQETLHLLIRSSTEPSIYAKNTYGQTCLHVAAEADWEFVNDCRQIAENLCHRISQEDMRVAFVNAQDAFGDTALHCATRGGRSSAVVSLLQLGADVERSNIFDQTALQLTSSGMRRIANVLLDLRAQQTPTNPSDKLSLGATLISREDLNIYSSFWEEQKQEVQSSCSGRSTALCVAVSKRSLVVVKKLLQSGADPNLPCCDEQTPISHAVASWCREIVACGSQANIQVLRVLVAVLLSYRADTDWDWVHASRHGTALRQAEKGGSEFYIEVKRLTIACQTKGTLDSPPYDLARFH